MASSIRTRPPHRVRPALRIVAVRSGGRLVGGAKLAEAVAAARRLPVADRVLLARHGIRIELHPVNGLEEGLLGATTVAQRRAGSSRWQPTRIRIAATASGRGSEPIGEVVQHEIGHAVSVLRRQDQSETAAIAYARRY